jgi:hypothetical protein
VKLYASPVAGSRDKSFILIELVVRFLKDEGRVGSMGSLGEAPSLLMESFQGVRREVPHQ